MNNRLSHISVFFSTVYNKAYYIVSALTIALLMEFITTVNIKVSNTVLYWSALLVYTIAMILLYSISKIYRKKHDSLEIKQLDIKYITKRIAIMLMYTVVATVIISIIHTLVLLKIIIG